MHKTITSSLLLGAALGLSLPALASSHREAPAVARDPTVDSTDLFAWVEGTNLVIIANYIPMQEPSGGPNFQTFGDDVLYEIHLARGSADLTPDLTWQFQFKTTPAPRVDPANLGAPLGGGKEFFSQLTGQQQTYTVTQVVGGVKTVLATNVPVAPANIGPLTNSVAYTIPAGSNYEQFFVDSGATSVIRPLGAGGSQGRVFAGPRDDPFFADVGAIFDLASLETVLGGLPADSLQGYNVHSLALEIPLTVANGGTAVTPGPSDAQTVAVWTTASRRKLTMLRRNGEPTSSGPWVQVSRLGFPLVNEVVIGLQDKDAFSRNSPGNDLANYGAYLLNPVLVRDAEALGFYSPGGPLAACAASGIAGLKSNRTDILDIMMLGGVLGHTLPLSAFGDVLRVDLGTASSFPNGRKVTPGNNQGDDVVDVLLSLLLCKLAANVPDGVNTNDTNFRPTFPFLAPPWEGSRQGNGDGP